MMKIKVSFGTDLRLFKYDGASLSEAFDALTTFVVETFDMQNFRLQYEDDENDLITIASEHELDEAFDFAMEQGKTLKVFVVADAAQQAARRNVEEYLEQSLVVEEKTEVPAEEPTTAVEDAEVPEEAGIEGVHALGQLLVEDEGFRQEFAAFAQDVVLQLREGDEFETAVQTALVSHEELSSHPFVRDRFVEMLPFIGQAAQSFVPFLKAIEPTTIPGMIDQVVEGIQRGEHMMPFLSQFGGGSPCGGFPFMGAASNGAPTMGPFGGLPMFCGGMGPRKHSPAGPGRGCHSGRRGRGRGHHHGRRGGRCGGKNKTYRADIVDASVTLADKAVVLPNSSVVKTWRIRNSGEEAFPEGTKLKYVGRPFNRLVDGVEFPVDVLEVGEEGEVSILLSTPTESGRYGSAWRLQLADGTPFGPMFRARVFVVNEGRVATESSDSDDTSGVYDDRSAPRGNKKERKLQKMLAKRAKLEERLAKLGSKIESAEQQIETSQDESAVEAKEDSNDEFFMVTAGEETADVVEGDEVFADQLADLQSMGFSDLELNRLLLSQYNGELQPVLNTLCELRA